MRDGEDLRKAKCWLQEATEVTWIRRFCRLRVGSVGQIQLVLVLHSRSVTQLRALLKFSNSVAPLAARKERD